MGEGLVRLIPVSKNSVFALNLVLRLVFGEIWKCFRGNTASFLEELASPFGKASGR